MPDLQDSEARPSRAQLAREAERMGLGAKSKGAEAEEWLVTYLDVLTLLLVFMVILISNADFRENLVQAAGKGGRVIDDGATEEFPARGRGDNPFEQYLERNSIEGFVRLDLSGNTPRLRFRDQIWFDAGSDELDAAAIDQLDRIYLLALEDLDQRLHLVIEGHEDPVGFTGARRRMSFERALKVANFFAARGFKEERISVIGSGSTRPYALPAGSADDARSDNRRVEIIVQLPPDRPLP